MAKNQLVEKLGNIAFLHDVSPQDLKELATAATLRDFKESQIIFREGDSAKCIYLVVFGKVALEVCAPGVGCKRILTVGPGEVLGWSALLGDSRMTATARTVEKSQLVELDAAKLQAIFAQNVEFGYEFSRRTMRALSKRLSATRMQLLDVYGSQLPAATPTAGV